MSVTVKGSYIKFNGVSYFRGNATAIAIGSYGRKKRPPFAPNFLEVDGHLTVPTKLASAVVVDIDSEASSKGDVTLNLHPVSGYLEGDVEAQWEALRTSKLKLVQFCLELGAVKRMVLQDEDAMDFLNDNKRSSRVAHQIWVVMEATEAEKFSGGAELSATFEHPVIKVTARGGVSGSRETTVTLSADSTYAYLLAKPEWDDQEKLTSFTTDQRG